MANKKSSTPAKTVTAVVKKDETKVGFFKRIGKWFREMKSELKKVVWPTSKQLSRNVLIALGMIVLAALIIWGFDEIAQLLVKALLSIVG